MKLCRSAKKRAKTKREGNDIDAREEKQVDFKEEINLYTIDVAKTSTCGQQENKRLKL